ncbi:MAG: hypothetical protein PF503_12530 [Desulfobacula sp.]|jgi:rubrerythrin|nr:hypothetical protein [Desulfobacula sp.]
MNKVESKLAKDIFESLTRAELRHIKKINQLYQSLSETGKWLDVVLTRESSERLDNIFAAAMSEMDEQIKGATTDIESLQTAAKLEKEGINYYQSKANTADDPFEMKSYFFDGTRGGRALSEYHRYN